MQYVDRAMIWQMIWFALELNAKEGASPSDEDLAEIAKKYGVEIIDKEGPK